MWHAMALETCGTFLPSECPLVSHMIMSFQKHHSPAMTTIPEESVLDEDIKVLRPLNEVKMDQINYHQIIRCFIQPESSLTNIHQQPETGGKQGKVVKGYVDQSGRVIPGSGSGASKLNSKSGASKPIGPLLRGGAPQTVGKGNLKANKVTSKAAATELASRQQSKRASQQATTTQIKTDHPNNDLFYNMDELTDLLGLQSSDIGSNSRTQQPQQQNWSHINSTGNKDGKLTSAETFTDSSYAQPAAEHQQIRPSTWQMPHSNTFSPDTP